MRRVFIAVVVIILSTSANAQNIIVSPQWLNDNAKDPDLVILYTGFVVKSDYDREHIEGSRFLWPEWLAFNTPESNMVPADAKTATKVLQDLGINKNSKVVICHRGADVTIASRMFLSLENYGLQGQVYFLNGGIEAWKRAGYPVTNQPSVFKKGNFVVTTDKGLLVNKDYVQDALQKQTSEIVDARLKRWYDGDPTGNPRDGHITGAKNIPYPDMVDSTNSIKPTEILLKNFSSVIPNKDKELVVYCFIGQTASVDYVVGRELGYKMKLYDGSMQEWSRDEKMPMEKTKKTQ